MKEIKTESGNLKVDGGYLNFEARLEGSIPCLLVHPAISDMRIWNREFGTGSIGKSMIRFDTRGLGESTPASIPYSPSEDIMALLNHLSVEKASLVAASNGGMAALDFAFRHPERVENLVLLGSGIELFEPENEGTIADIAQDFMSKFKNVANAFHEKETQLTVKLLIEMFGSGLTGENLELARRMIVENLEEIVTDASSQHQKYLLTQEGLSDMEVPTLILVGKRDHPIFGWSTEKLKDSIRGSRRVEINGADHLINLSAPIDFDLNVGQFLGHKPGSHP